MKQKGHKARRKARRRHRPPRGDGGGDGRGDRGGDGGRRYVSQCADLARLRPGDAGPLEAGAWRGVVWTVEGSFDLLC